jgi:NADPH:quinone reductase-like Zn-dependent oxidoreductase
MAAIEARAVRFREIGEPLDVLTLDTVEVADPGPGEIRVRVLATGLNPADWELCRGFLPGTLPRGIGYDVAGTVESVGANVTDAAVGDLVFGTADFAGRPSAGAADLAVLNGWWPVPAGLDPAQAAVLPMVLQTAVWTLGLIDPQPGSTILVHGAGGMVGYAAVQVAIRSGARVIATAGPTFTPDLESFGAIVTTYGDGMADRVRALADGPVDHVLDVSRPNAGAIAALVDIAGDPKRVVTISNHDEARAAGARVNIDELMATGAFPTSQFLAEYAEAVATGAFRLPIAATFPLTSWREAAQLSVAGAPHGKVVLVP